MNDTTGDGQGFPEISGSTLLASVAYRMAVIRPDLFASSPSFNSSNSTPSNSNATYISWADNIRAVQGAYDASGHPHITKTGIATPAVDPLNWHDTTPYTSGSPEGQNFVVLMYAAEVCAAGCFWFGWDDDDELRDGWGSDDDGEFRKDGEEADAWWAEESFGYIWQDVGVNSF